MSKPSAPPPPDYAAAATAQGAASLDTAVANNAMNRVNQVGPYGDITYSLKAGADPNNPQVGDYTQTTSLSPASQQTLDSTQGITNSLLQTGQTQLNQVNNQLSQPFSTTAHSTEYAPQGSTFTGAPGAVDYTAMPGAVNYGSAPDAATHVAAPGAANYQAGPAAATYTAAPGAVSYAHAAGPANLTGGPGLSNFSSGPGPASGYSGGVQASGFAGGVPGTAGQFVDGPGTSNFANLQAGPYADVNAYLQQLQRSNTNAPTGSFNPGQVDTTFGGAGNVPVVDSSTRPAVEAAIMSRLQPQFEQQAQAMRTQLLNSGIEVGTPAYNQQMDALNRSHNDALMQAVLAGGQEESRQTQLLAALQNQAYAQAQGRGTFAQAGQTANNTFGLDRSQFDLNAFNAGNAATQANNATALNAGNFYLGANQQNFNQSKDVNNSFNANQAAIYQQGLAGANLHNQNAQNAFGQSLASAGVQDTAAQAGLTAATTSANLLNHQVDANYQQGLDATNIANQNQRDLFAQGVTNTGIANQNANTIQGQTQAGIAYNNANATADYGQTLTATQMANQAATAGFDQNLATTNLNNANATADYGQNLTAAQMTNANADTAYNQTAASTAADNLNLTHNFDQTTAQNQAANQAATADYQQNLTADQMANANAAATYQQGLAGSTFDNQASQQQLAQDLQMYNLPLNELNALRQGTQITSPTVSNYYTAGAQPAPVFDATVAGANYNMAAYQGQMSGYNALLGGLGSLGGSYLGTL